MVWEMILIRSPLLSGMKNPVAGLIPVKTYPA
jgi:hypothetical protein